MEGKILCKIFESLNDTDLSTVANVCEKFKQNALVVFSSRYKQKCFRFCIDYDEFIAEFRQFGSILKNFGPSITSLDTGFARNRSQYSQQFMELIVDHCGDSLIELKLDCITFARELIPNLGPLMERLQKVHLRGCHFESGADAVAFFSLCAELHTLTINNSQTTLFGSSNFPGRMTIPKLKSLTILNCIGIENGSVKKFLQASSHLKEVYIKRCWKLSSKIVQSIVHFAPRIEKLKLYLDDGDVIKYGRHRLHKLKALEWLEIDCEDRSFSPILRELARSKVPLKCLILKNFSADKELFDGIRELKRLVKLEFYGGWNMNKNMDYFVDTLKYLSELSDLRYDDGGEQIKANHFLEIIRRAPKLEYLQLSASLDVQLFGKIVNVVTARQERRRLEINLPVESITVPPRLLKAYPEFLKIDYKRNYKPSEV